MLCAYKSISNADSQRLHPGHDILAWSCGHTVGAMQSLRMALTSAACSVTVILHTLLTCLYSLTFGQLSSEFPAAPCTGLAPSWQ